MRRAISDAKRASMSLVLWSRRTSGRQYDSCHALLSRVQSAPDFTPPVRIAKCTSSLTRKGISVSESEVMPRRFVLFTVPLRLVVIPGIDDARS